MKRAIPIAFVVVVACSNAPMMIDPTGSCRAIASACHPYDTGAGIGHDCHELGHVGDDLKCAPKKAECLAACPPKDAGDVHDAMVADVASDVAVDPCPAFCTCMEQTCSMVTGYPYKMQGACLDACKKLGPDERACFPKWCEMAKSSSQMMHLCEHAWGAFGIDECDTL